MGEVYFELDKESVNNMMIRLGYGKPYSGGTKQEFTLEELDNICNLKT